MCGAVRYESTMDAVMQANCYCRDCQRSTGGAFAPVVLVPKDAFKLTKGRVEALRGGGRQRRQGQSRLLRRVRLADRESPVRAAIHRDQSGSLDDPESVSAHREHFCRQRTGVGAAFSRCAYVPRNPG